MMCLQLFTHWFLNVHVCFCSLPYQLTFSNLSILAISDCCVDYFEIRTTELHSDIDSPSKLPWTVRTLCQEISTPVQLQDQPQVRDPVTTRPTLNALRQCVVTCNSSVSVKPGSHLSFHDSDGILNSEVAL